jgi:hypothetical protein
MSDRKITSTFKLVFCTVVGLTLLSGGMALKLASQEELSPQQTRVFETFSATWQMGAVGTREFIPWLISQVVFRRLNS